jgi:hypothetical protein
MTDSIEREVTGGYNAGKMKEVCRRNDRKKGSITQLRRRRPEYRLRFLFKSIMDFP